MGRKKQPEGTRMPGRFLLPGVGDGLVDPDFDNIESAELDLIESVGAHRSDQSEDQN